MGRAVSYSLYDISVASCLIPVSSCPLSLLYELFLCPLRALLYHQAAHGFVSQHRWSASVGVVINYESSGASLPGKL